MKTLLKFLLAGASVLLAAYLLPGVSVDSFGTALLVVIVMALVNTFVRPILVFFTLPISILTLGLFLLVINVLMIFLVDYLVAGLQIDGVLNALLFGIVLSLANGLFGRLLDGSTK
jgi:putative membrane protein